MLSSGCWRARECVTVSEHRTPLTSQLSAALRAQASGLGAQQGSGELPTRAGAVLGVAILLGAMAGALAGVISTW